MKKMLMTLVTVVALGSVANAAENTTAPSTTKPMTGTTMPSTTPPSAIKSDPTTTGSTPSTAPMGSVFITTHPTMGEHLSSKIVGADVYAMSGERIGDVNDLILGSDGKVAGLVVGVGGFLGMGEKNVAISWTSVTMGTTDGGKPRLTVPVTKDALKNATAFDTSGKS